MALPSLWAFVIVAVLLVFSVWSICVCVFLSVAYCVCIRRRNRPGALRLAPWSYMIGIGWLQVIIGWPLYQLCLGPPLASPSDLPPAMIVGQATGAYMAWLSLPMWSAAFLAYVLALRRRRRELSASGKTSGEPQIVMPLPPHDTGASLGNGRLFQIQNAED